MKEGEEEDKGGRKCIKEHARLRRIVQFCHDSMSF